MMEPFIFGAGMKTKSRVRYCDQALKAIPYKSEYGKPSKLRSPK